MKQWAKRAVLFGIDGAGTFFEQTPTPNIDRIFRNGAVCRRALEEMVVEGVKTTIPFQKRILMHKNFAVGKYDTGFVERLMQDLRKARKKEQ